MRGERRAFQVKAQQVGRCRWEGSRKATESGMCCGPGGQGCCWPPCRAWPIGLHPWSSGEPQRVPGRPEAVSLWMEEGAGGGTDPREM